jgi:putative peptidoglycan lipid II flippase
MWRDESVREIGKLIIPRTLGLAVGQINLLVTTTIASTLIAGSVAIFNLANNLQFFAVGIIGVSFAVAAFPTLSELAVQDKREEMIDSLSRTIRQVLFFIVPLTIVFLILRAQIVRVVLGSGKFDWTDTITTADALAFFSLSLFAQSLVYLLARAFYALRDTVTPLWIAAISAGLNIILSLYLKNYLDVLGLALAFSISAIMQMALLWIMLRLRLHSLHESKILLSLYKISVAGIVMAIITQILKTPLSHWVDMTKFWGILTQGAVAGIIGLLVYWFICWLLRLEEMQDFLASAKRKWLKLQNVPREVEENK